MNDLTVATINPPKAPAKPKAKAVNPNTQAAVFQATETLVRRDGASALSIAAIAAAAGIGVGTVYNHFEDKEDLLFKFIARRFAELMDSYRPAFQFTADKSWADNWRALVEKIFAEDSLTIAYAELSEAVFELLGASARRKLLLQFENDLSPLLAAGLAGGSLRPWPIQFHAGLFVAYLEAGVRELREKRATHAEVAELVWRGFTAGHAT